MTVGTSALVSVKVLSCFGSQPICMHPLAELGEGHGQVRRGRALADAALAVDGEDLGLADLHIGIEVDLQAALAVEADPCPPDRSAWFTGMFTPKIGYSGSCGTFSGDAFEPVFELLAGAVQRLEVSSSGSQYWRSWASSRRLYDLGRAVGFSAARRSRISSSSTKVSVMRS
jgi:hypothetical protein